MDDVPELVAIELQEVKQMQHDNNNNTRIPVTVLTGALGAGKTTLLSHILTRKNNLRIAVILNDIGDTESMERDMLAHTIAESRVLGGDNQQSKNDQVLENWVELKNGCMCCSLKSPSVAALERMVQKSRQSPTPIEHVVIELSGVADPNQVAQMLWMDDSINSELQLDGVVCLVDATRVAQANDSSWLAQIATADCVIVNKVDLLTRDSLDSVMAKVQLLNPLATLKSATRCQVSIEKLLCINAYTSNSNMPAKFQTLPQAHHSDIDTLYLELPIESAVARLKFERWLETLLWDNDDVIVLRAKGVLLILEDQEHQTIVQAVGQVYECRQSLKWSESKSARQCRLVLIGRNLSRLQEKLQKQFTAINDD